MSLLVGVEDHAFILLGVTEEDLGDEETILPFGGKSISFGLVFDIHLPNQGALGSQIDLHKGLADHMVHKS